MLTIAQIKENPQYIISRLAVKGFDGNNDIAKILVVLLLANTALADEKKAQNTDHQHHRTDN